MAASPAPAGDKPEGEKKPDDVTLEQFKAAADRLHRSTREILRQTGALAPFSSGATTRFRKPGRSA